MSWCIVHLAGWSPRKEQCDTYVKSSGECSTGMGLRDPRHAPGEPHRYRIECEDCGQLGTIRLSVEP